MPKMQDFATMLEDTNTEVNLFLAKLNHPMIREIELLRRFILSCNPHIKENIKWNSPNYTFHGKDRITMHLKPHTKIQLVLHRGAQKQIQPATRLIDDSSGLLQWKENDRAIITFPINTNIESLQTDLTNIINQWIQACE